LPLLLRGQEDPSPTHPQCAASVPASAVVKNAVKSRCTKGGKSVNLPQSGATQTWQSAATANACAPLPTTTEVTPILAPFEKSVPQGISNGRTAAIRAFINAAALVDSGDNNIKYSPYCQGSRERDTTMMMMMAHHHWKDNNQPMMRNTNQGGGVGNCHRVEGGGVERERDHCYYCNLCFRFLCCLRCCRWIHPHQKRATARVFPSLAAQLPPVYF
jgi:hypothetical protein